MQFNGIYIKNFVNADGDWDFKECQIKIIASSLEEATKIDKEYWNIYREPAWLEEVQYTNDAHATSISTFMDREMPYLVYGACIGLFHTAA